MGVQPYKRGGQNHGNAASQKWRTELWEPNLSK